MKALWLAALLGLVACHPLLDPCPSGSDPDGDRCVKFDLEEAGVQGEDAGRDGSLPAPVADAGEDAGAMDASLDAMAAVDAGSDASDPACSAGDVQAWYGLHTESGLVDSLLACAGPVCMPDLNCIDAECVREREGLTACQDCVAGEGSCVFEFCRSACGLPGNDAECRACVCEAGCVAEFAACSGRPLDVCNDVYGRAALESEHRIDRPLVYRLKESTGLIAAGPLLAAPSERSSAVLGLSPDASPYHSHWSKNFAHLVGFRVDERPYLLQAKARCDNDPCLARISPVLVDGSLGQPVWLETWSRGWDRVESFQAAGATYLLRFKTGALPTEDESAGALRIDQVNRDAVSGALTLKKVLARDEPLPDRSAFTNIESFVHAGATYLLFHRVERGGEVRIDRVKRLPTGALELVTSSTDLALSGGFDMVETFPINGRWYALMYRSTNLDGTGEPAGRVQVHAFAGTSSAVALTPALHTGMWTPGITRLVPFRDDQHAYLLQLKQVAEISLTVSLVRMEAPANFPTSLGTNVFEGAWGATNPWNVVEILGRTPW